MIFLFMLFFFFFFKQKTAYEMLSGDWSSDVCSSDLCRSTFPARSNAMAFSKGPQREPTTLIFLNDNRPRFHRRCPVKGRLQHQRPARLGHLLSQRQPTWQTRCFDE